MHFAIWAYPWDLLDEGIDTALGRMADAGLQAVSVASAYHSVRALCPHNPRRAVYHGEGGVVYFRPDEQTFREARIRPVESALLAEGDPLAMICEAARKRGLKVHAWTVLHHNTRLGTAYPDCTLENAFGDRYPFGLCPAHPDVRAYTLGLVRSLAARENLDTIELESLGYMGLDHTGHHSKQGLELDGLHRYLLSVCFCPHCAARMKAHGVVVEQAREAVVREMRSLFAGQYRSLQEEDTLDALMETLGRDNAEGILAARDEVVLTLLEEVYWLLQGSGSASPASRPPTPSGLERPQRLSVMVSGSPLTTGAHAGVTLSQARPWADRLLIQAFQREADAIRRMVADVAVRRGSTPVFAGLPAVAPFVRSGAELTERVAAALEAGAEGIQFYHYGLMPLGNLAWIRTAIAFA